MTMMYKFCWAMWIGGTILIVASWGDIVSPTVGWIGFVVAMGGTLLSLGARQPQQQGQSKPIKADPEEPAPRA